MRKALIAVGTAAAALLLPAAPASAQNDCIFAGWEYVVHDAVDCAHYIIESAIG